ncbi:ABC transporter permease subunit [Paenibacillus oleatilyticus]|uniref:ABC transporter permease subunit n=1 Tax=Paenibacillus oleatilyticus TaxID=2594886 RepID=A0ABV4UUG8_9BACL
MSLWGIGQAVVIYLVGLQDISQDYYDAAHEFTNYWKVILPLAKPAVLSVALFQFTNSWTDFIGPLLYLTNEVYDVARASTVSKSEGVGVGAHDGGSYDDDDSRRYFVLLHQEKIHSRNCVFRN